MLATPDPVRARLIALLNPQGSDVIQLSDKELKSEYVIVSENNYSQLPDRGLLANVPLFDAMHGYYVVLDVGPLR